MGFAMRKREREQGLSEVQLLARACRKFRRKYPGHNFNACLILALNERRCFGRFRYYCDAVREELERLDREKQSKKAGKSRGKMVQEEPVQEDGFSESAVYADSEFVLRMMGTEWRRLDLKDRIGTLRATLARRDHFVPIDDR